MLKLSAVGSPLGREANRISRLVICVIMKAINGKRQGAIAKLSRQANGRFLLHSAGLDQETRAILTSAGLLHLNWNSFTGFSIVAFVWKHQTHCLNVKAHSPQPGIALNP